MKLIAVHAIQRRDAKGQRADVAPKASFEASGEEAEYLLRAGAAKKAPGASAETDAEPTPAKETASGDGPNVELTGMTVKQLVQFAKDHEIEIDETAKKAEIVDTIEAALRADDDLV